MDVTEVKTEESNGEETTTDGTINDSDGDSSHSAHSRIAEGEPSFQFEDSYQENRGQSSPVAGRSRWNPDLSDISTPHSTPDSWHLMGVSQPDDPAYAAVMHVRRRRENDNPRPSESSE